MAPRLQSPSTKDKNKVAHDNSKSKNKEKGNGGHSLSFLDDLGFIKSFMICFHKSFNQIRKPDIRSKSCTMGTHSTL